MTRIFSQIEARAFGLVGRTRPQGRLWRWFFWALLVWLASFLLGNVPALKGICAIIGLLSFPVAVVTGIPLLIRWAFRTVLWKVRNRLIVTYLLMALAPVVLFGTLAFLAAYLFAGQFAIFAATSRLEEQLNHLESKNRSYLAHVAEELAQHPALRSVSIPEYADALAEHTGSDLQVDAYLDGKPLQVTDRGGVTAVDLPAWMTQQSYRGVAVTPQGLVMRVADSRKLGSHTVLILSTLPLRQHEIEHVAEGLGRLSLISARDLKGVPEKKEDGAHVHFNIGAPSDGDKSNVEVIDANTASSIGVRGGVVFAQKHFWDVPVGFVGQLPTTDWSTGHQDDSTLVVYSRPSLIADTLFKASLQTADIVRNVFIVIAVFFGILELVAFLMAVRLNQTITQSVHGLYEATRAIDAGNLSHRIQVRRKDQLAALSSSFNGMAVSLERLLAEQREKQRLESELSIAQEVQNNLFPHDKLNIPTLELHGTCRPARSVSGDYYDFLLFGGHSLGLALGDISGKGISAALLMASLHSAVRAYRFADGGTGEDGEWFAHPALLLTRLNRHLYQSTQPEKYATLFLAHYDARSSLLTYSNGGQLPPLLLRKDGSINRLTCGGPVVGLLDGMSFEQEKLTLNSGDILVAYSDGVTEPENEYGDFGEERLIEIVRAHREQPLEVISERVLSALTDWIGANEQPDDITLVLARQL